MPTVPSDLTTNFVLDALLNWRKLPVKEPPLLLAILLVVVAKSMRSPTPSNVPVAWVMVRSEVFVEKAVLVAGREMPTGP